MKNVFLFTISLVLLLIGCGPQENPEQLKEVNQNLERSNGFIKEDIRLVVEDMLGMQRDLATSAIASVWLARAKQISEHADSIKCLIKDLKTELYTQSDSLKREYVTLVKQLINVNGRGAQLFQKLNAFKDSIPIIIFRRESEFDSILPPFYKKEISSFLEKIPLLPGYRNSLSTDEQVKYEMKWLEKNFGRSSSLMAMVMLNKVENDVLATEKMLVDHCNYSIARGCILSYRKFCAITVLSSSYVKKGQPIEVTAGVGKLSIDTRPVITFNDKVMKPNDDGTFVHTFTANGEPGEHIAKVKIEFSSTDGSREHITKTLKYTIADEK